jgi:hypothetical protein
LSRAAISRARRSVACWFLDAAAIVEWPIRCISSQLPAEVGRLPVHHINVSTSRESRL